jgi:putative nucleotidyltransferase with HDIG domain
MRIPRVVKDLAAQLKTNGFQCHLVGGAVRDMLIGREHTDFDIATDARPAQVSTFFRRVIPTGVRHGTVTVLFKGSTFEVTTFRAEAGYSDGRHPDKVSFVPSLFEDLSRRDFTINAIAYDLLENRFNDPYGGREDLDARLIRAIRDPTERFREDGLRPLRACRFAAQLSFSVEERTKEAMTGSLDMLARVSAERVRDEILKMVAAPLPSVGLRLMEQTGILGVILPELAEGIGVLQGELHCYDVFTHSLYSCDAAPSSSATLRLAALLHDVGKARARGQGEDGRPTFYSHERFSAEIATHILTRLRLPTAVVKRVSHLVANHMFNYQEEWSDAAVRRLLARVGEDGIDDLMSLRRADQIGMCRENAESFPVGLARFAERVRRVLAEKKVFTIKHLAVDGNDVMERTGLPQGPAVGAILDELLQTVIDDPGLNERERLLDIAMRFHLQRITPEDRRGPPKGP